MPGSWFFKTDIPYSDKDIKNAPSEEAKEGMRRDNASVRRYNRSLEREDSRRKNGIQP